jgi:hypothetical protein
MKTGLKFLFIVLILIVNLHAGDFQSRVLIQAKWGNADEEFGLRLEAEGNCPQALAVDQDGNLAILDPVNKRVQLFSPEGKWSGNFAIAANSFELRFQNSQLLILAPYDYAITRYTSDGKFIEKIRIDRTIEMIDGFHAGENDVFIRTIDQAEYAINKQRSAQQTQSAKPGASTSIPGVRIQTQWIDPSQGKLLIENEKSGKTQSIVISTHDELGSLVFLDSDLAGNIYVRKELFSSAGKPYFEIDKFDRNGTLRATIRIEHENIVMPFKPITIDRHGNIYFLEIKSEGFALLQWQEK